MAGLGGVIGIVLGWLGYQVGQRTDAADVAGSLHAKTTAIVEDTAVIGTSADDRADNTVMGWSKTQIKSWQRVTGTTNGSNALTLSVSSVDPSKCFVFVNGCQWCYQATATTSTMVSVDRYISAFDATSITLTISGVPGNTWTNGTFSVIVVEFY